MNTPEPNPRPDGSIVIELDHDQDGHSGVGRVGIVANAVTTTQDALAQGLKLIGTTATAFLTEIRQVPKLPDETEITFGIKATGEIGGFAIAKSSAEANFSVKLKWRRSSELAGAGINSDLD